MTTKFDLHALSKALAGKLGVKELELGEVDVGCSSVVFRAHVPGGRDIFVKVYPPTHFDELERTLGFLRSAGQSKFLPEAMLSAPLDWQDVKVMAFSWQDSKHILPENMTDNEARSLARAYIEISSLFAKSQHIAPPRDIVALYNTIESFAKRFAILRGALSSLLSIKEDLRTYSKEKLVAVHGDLQYRNFGFVHGEVASFYDFDTLRYGAIAEDLLYAISERMMRLKTSRTKRRHLVHILGVIIAECPWPIEEWWRALAICRIRAAAKRISKHPANPFVAFDVLRRDRRFGEIARSLDMPQMAKKW